MSDKYLFTAKNGETYQIIFSDTGETIEVFQNNRKLGFIGFVEEEIEIKYSSDIQYIVQSLRLDNCKRLGIGTEIFRLHKEIFRKPIIARPHDGIKRKDGTHLTDDGPCFIEAMRQKGYVEPSDDDKML